jgi:polyphenol oxidase
MPPIEFEHPRIFPKAVIAGVTLRNAHLFPHTGLSLLGAQILSDSEVHEHRQLTADALGVPLSAMQFQKQVHGQRVRRVWRTQQTNAAMISSDDTVSDAELTECESDGMISSEQGVVLCVGMADCAGILLYDTETQAVGAIHSGWSGTRQNIAGAAVVRMQEEFGTKAANLLAYIGPAASGDCYEVQWDVAQHFPASVLRRMSSNGEANSEVRWLLDNRKRIIEQLIESGVKASNIEVSAGCTIADKRYHSHRRDGANAGRMVAFIGVGHREQASYG